MSSCNLWGGIDSPSGDAQLISAARGAFDNGDYVKALEYYQQLSSNNADIRISETALVTMAQEGIFSVQDLVASLGDGRGNGNSLVTIANSIAARGKTAASFRTTLDQQFVNAGAIVNTHLRAYTRFLIAMAMTTQVLASGVGADGVLTAEDLASNVTACRALFTNCADPGVGQNALRDTGVPSDPGTWNGNAVDSGWGSTASIAMVITASNAADSNFSTLTGGTGLGIAQVLGQLGALGAGADARRYGLLTNLFPAQ